MNEHKIYALTTILDIISILWVASTNYAE